MQLKAHRGPKAQTDTITLKPSAKIHIMGLCGTAMSSLAGLLKEKGYLVSGSDRRCYPPVSEELKKLKIPVLKGFTAENLSPDLDLVVVGNVVSKNMPSVQALFENNYPYSSLPEVLEPLVLKNKKTVMVAGTHGKTTVSFLSAWLLDQCGLAPGFMIGGVSENFKTSFRFKKKSDWFVIEGDEYDTAFFEKTPKFLHYPSMYTILTGIEFDHADIYKNIKEVEKAFQLLLSRQKPEHNLIACIDCPLVKKLLSQHPSLKVWTYGAAQGDYQIQHRQTFKNSGQIFTLQEPNGNIQKIQIPLHGKHNALNALSVWILSRILNLPKKQSLLALKNFKGVRRRFQVLGVFKGVTLIEDFAHHPSSVSAVIQTAKELYPQQRIVALFEPGSNTSKKSVFQKEYEKALNLADLVFYRSVRQPAQIKEKFFSARRLAESLNKKSQKAFFAEDVKILTQLVQKKAKTGDIILILSNGDFGGIYSLLKQAFS